MKFLLSLFLLTVLIVPSQAEKVERYLFGGVSTYDENEAFSDVKRGIGFRFGGGLQFSDRLGLEFFVDNSPSLDPSRAADLLTNEIQALNQVYGQYDATIEVNAERNYYTSVVGTLTFPITDKRSWIFKGGLSYAAFETSLKPGFADYFVHKHNDVSATFSGGMSFRRNENRSTEFSLTHTTGDARATAAHVIFRHHF